MSDRYVIVSRDWQRFDRTYAVVDTHSNPHAPKWVLQTNNFAHAIQCRDEMNAEQAAS
jgi:hypothetical protein